MKKQLLFIGTILLAGMTWAGDYTYTTANSSITITGYTGAGGELTIPNTINGFPVTQIGVDAFYYNENITHVTIPDSVYNIGAYAFSWSSISSATVGHGVTNIGEGAFSECEYLTNVIFGINLMTLGDQAFFFSYNLEDVYFYGDAPSLGDSDVFGECDNAKANYLQETSGWGSTLGGIPTAQWESPSTRIIEDFESINGGPVWIPDGSPVASAIAMNADFSPATSGDQDSIEVGMGGEYWNAFTNTAVDMNTTGLEWRFAVAADKPNIRLSFDFGHDADTQSPNGSGILYRILDADNGDALIGEIEKTVRIYDTTMPYRSSLIELGTGNYKLQITSDRYEQYGGCMIDNIQIESSAAQGDSVITRWNPRTDFVLDSNPNGQWSYGILDTTFSNFTAMVWDGNRAWTSSGGYIWTNETAALEFGVTPGQLTLHPGDSAGALPTVLRWTAPLFQGEGSIQMAGAFFTGASGLVSSRVSHNGSSLWDHMTGNFNLSFTVNPGDTIDFIVYGVYPYGSTPLETTIELTTTRLISLAVESNHGTPVPAIGTHEIPSGSIVTCSVNSVTQDLINYSPTGWSLVGQDPASGTTNWFETTVTNNAALTWNWQTNYWLEVSTSGLGTIDISDGFLIKGSEHILTATPAPGWLFMGWSGDAFGTNEAFMMMTEPRAVMATFSDDADGDGLSNNKETTLGSDPWNSDTDGDGFDDKLEVDNGGSPTVSDQWRVDYIHNNGGDFDLYPSNVVLNVEIGQILLKTDGGIATLNLQLKESDDLVSWTNSGLPQVWSEDIGSEKKFFRVRSSGQ